MLTAAGRRWQIVLLLNGFFGVAAAHAAEQISIHEVPTRPGVTVSVLLIKPEQPVATLLLFPGGNGQIAFRQDGSTTYRGFPVRNPGLFAQQGFMTAVINTPSDGTGRHFFRDSVTHTEDVRYVIDFLRKYAALPLWLVGHSAGSTSVANAAIKLADKNVSGIVLISSENGKPDRRSGYLDLLDLEKIKLPTLVVHHEEDECEYTLFGNARKMMPRLKAAVRSELVSYKGGGPVSGNPCGSLHYHGFPGLEQDVAVRIGDWINTELKR